MAAGIKLHWIGHAWSTDWRAWRLGWAKPVINDMLSAGPADGDWWLCLGPLALMFEEEIWWDR